MQQKRNLEALIRVMRWKRAAGHLVGGHRRSMRMRKQEMFWNVATGEGECRGERKRSDVEGADWIEWKRQKWECWVWTWWREAVREAVCGSLKHSGRMLFSIEKNKKMSDSSREGLPWVSKDKGMLSSWHCTCTSFWTESRELFSDPGC